MSASNKKKLRKEAMGAELTQREIREQAQAKIAKRNKTIYLVIGVVCAVAAVALLVWNSHFWESGATAAVIDGEKYKVADLQYYYAQARNSEIYTAQLYAQYGITSPYDTTKGDGAQWYDEAENMTYADYFRQQALDSLQETAVVCKAAKDAGYTLSADGQAQIDSALAQLDSYSAQYSLTRGAYISQMYGVSEKVYIRNLTNDTLANEYSQHYQESFTYDDAALEEYYSEHADTLDSFTYRIFTVDGSAPTTLDADGHQVDATDEEKSAAMEVAKVQADTAVAEINAAEDKEQAFIEAAPKYVAESYKDAYADESYSLQENISGSTLSSNAASAYTWLIDSSRKAGDVTSIEVANSGYQVVLFLGRERVEDATVNIRHILIRAETSEGAETNSRGVAVPTQEQMDAAKAEAERLLEEWKAGEATEESFAALAREHSSDSGSSSVGGLYTYVTEGSMVANFNDWIFDSARQPGDTGLVENGGDDATYYGWHVIYFQKGEDPAWKGTAISAKQSSDQTDWFNGLLEASTAEAAAGMKYVGAANTATATPSAFPVESEEPEESPAA